MTNKTLIIAEIGTSHQCNISNAKELIFAASTAGADCIKFQWVYADEILHPKTGYVKLPGGMISLYERFKQLEVPSSFYTTLLQEVHKQGKLFMCSPFGLKSLNELFKLKPDYIKIASPELNHYSLLKELVRLEMSVSREERIPVVLSSGVSTMQDILFALDILFPLLDDNLVSLLHCVTSYPAPAEDYNLSLLSKYIKELSLPVGVSDHSLDPVLVPVLSTVFGGTLVEKHITLSKQTDGLDDPVALDTKGFTKMVQEIRKAEISTKDEVIFNLNKVYGEDIVQKTIGNGNKELANSEKDNYGRTNRSIHFMRSMRKGEIITQNDIAVLRTEKILSVGLEPKYFDSVLGKQLCSNVNDGEGLLWEHIAE